MSNGADAHLGTWLVVGVLIGLALALLVGVLAVAVRRARRARRREQAPAAPAQPGPAGFADDDLPGFAERPPGWTAAPAADSRAPAAGDPAANGAPAGGAGLGRGGTTALSAAVLLLVAAVGVAWVGGGTVASAQAPPIPVPSAAPSSTPPALPADPDAGALALESVPLGPGGIAASATFQGVVLEPRAVGLTVTYPSVSVSTDGRRALAHVRLPTFNCLTPDPPADPAAAGCAGSLTEYADLADPGLRVSRDGDRIELDGLFPTYTRPNGSAPEYTGRAYRLSATLAADGPVEQGSAPATGTVRIGTGAAATTADPGVNVLQRPGR